MCAPYTWIILHKTNIYYVEFIWFGYVDLDCRK